LVTGVEGRIREIGAFVTGVAGAVVEAPAAEEARIAARHRVRPGHGCHAFVDIELNEYGLRRRAQIRRVPLTRHAVVQARRARQEAAAIACVNRGLGSRVVARAVARVSYCVGRSVLTAAVPGVADGCVNPDCRRSSSFRSCWSFRSYWNY
jgi:hypothetical protein